MHTSIRTLVPGLLLSLLTAGAGAQTAPAGASASAAATVTVDIARQPMESALNALASQTGLQLLFQVEDVAAAGLTAPRVSGKFQPEQALRQLLANSGLKYQFINPRTVAIRAEAQGRDTSSALTPAAQMRLAGMAEQKRSGQEVSAAGGEVIVQDRKIRPYEDGNLDLPRTIDDAQPYYIFDAQTIDTSGVASIEEFLQQRLLMNTVAQTQDQSENGGIGTTSINLFNLGTDETLILVNGRRQPGIMVGTTQYQADLNGIPLSAVERIEVLPTSAGAIYGASAIGGVVNIVLKQDYSGGEVSWQYNNKSDTDAPTQNLSISYGNALGGSGKTRFNVQASVNTADPKRRGDGNEMNLYNDYFARAMANNPTFFYQGSPYLGSLPNIQSLQANQKLTLKAAYGGGSVVPLNNTVTHVPAGAAPGMSRAELGAALLANAGEWDWTAPPTTQSRGLLQQSGSPMERTFLSVGLTHKLSSRVELDGGLTFSRTETERISNNFGQAAVQFQANNAFNPFNQAVRVSFPDAGESKRQSRLEGLQLRLGARARLGDWTAQLDLSRSQTEVWNNARALDNIRVTAAQRDGLINPFVDTLLYPMDTGGLFSDRVYTSANLSDAIMLRASGPLLYLPWGAPQLTLALNHTIGRVDDRKDTATTIDTAGEPIRLPSVYYPMRNASDDLRVNLLLPLVKAGWLPGLNLLEFDITGSFVRSEYSVGTNGRNLYTGAYIGTTIDGQPWFGTENKSGHDHTLALRYQPVAGLTLRASLATSYKPPTSEQLSADPEINPNGVRLPDFTQVDSLSGGNPDLRPQSANAFNLGLIFEPVQDRLRGLRLNVEYRRIEQKDAISALSGELILANESLWPERVVRNELGEIELIDVTYMNVYTTGLASWGVSASDQWHTARYGTLSLNLTGEIMDSNRQQLRLDQPDVEYVGYSPSYRGVMKYRANGTLSWAWGNWQAGWTARYIDGYKQQGYPGDPATRYFPTATRTFILTQGADTVPSQLYHDLNVGYRFAPGKGPMADVSLLLSVKNVLRAVPPMDVSNWTLLAFFGDADRASYSLKARKQF